MGRSGSRPFPEACMPGHWLVLVLGLLTLTGPTPLRAQSLISWGENYDGQVGDGTSAVSRPPSDYTQIGDALQAACGRTWCMARRSDGTVQSWGTSLYGALGRTGAAPNALPGEIGGLPNIVAIAAGTDHGLALTGNGFVYGWGRDDYGQLGDGNLSDRPSPSLATAFPTDVQAIGAGASHSVVLLADGTVWTVGDNALGQLGRAAGAWSPTPGQVAGLDGVVQIAVGPFSNLALKSDGTVWGWGLNSEGVLGNGTTIDAPTPVQVSGLADAALIALGSYNGFALKNDGTVWGWGANASLGHGVAAGTSTLPQLIPSLTGVSQIRAGDGGYSMALLYNGRLRVWGSNDATNVFNDATQTQSFVPTPVSGLAGVTGLDVGYRTALARGTALGQCDVYIHGAGLSDDDRVILDFQSGTIPYRVYRSSDAALDRSLWPIVDSNVVDMDPVEPDLQWVEPSNDVSPIGIWYYQIVPDDANCDGMACTPGTAGCGWEDGQVVTHTQDVWGTPTTDAAMLLAAYFDAVYFTAGGVLRVGGTYTMTFASAVAIFTYQPAVGTPGPLNADLSDPTSSTAAGQFGGEVVGLKLNIDFSDADHTLGTSGLRFGDLTLCGFTGSQAVLNGTTGRDFLATANVALGGGPATLPIAELNDIAVQLNASFGGGLVSPFAQQHIFAGPCP